MLTFTGLQPTGRLHLGHLLGVLLPLRAAALPAPRLVAIADLHALTTQPDPRQLRHNTRVLARALLATAPPNTLVFCQSAVPGHTDLAWALMCLAPLGQLRRMTQFKDKAAKHHASLGLLAYPVLQAADILLYRATHVPVGHDQRQHLELSRDLAAMLNRALGTPLLPLPQAVLPAKGTARIMSLREPTKKMSKSAGDPRSRLHLDDDEATLRATIAAAVTDAEPRITLDEARTGVYNLVTIHAALGDTSMADAAADLDAAAQHGGLRAAKARLADRVVATLAPIRAAMQALDDDAVDAALARGRDEAQQRAAATRQALHAALGLPPPP